MAGRTVTLSDQNALAQRINNRIALWRGEWYQDTTIGIDYLSIFNVSFYQDRRLNTAIRNVILEDPYVDSVVSVATDFDAEGELSITYEIKSKFGKITGSL